MRGSSHKDFSVYDFNEGDEAVEAASGKFKPKLQSKRPMTDGTISPHTFLQAFNGGFDFKQTEVVNVSPIVLHANNNARLSYQGDAAETKLAVVEEESDLDENTESMPNYHEDAHVCREEFESENFTRVESLVIGASSPVSELPSDEASGDVISDDEVRWSSNSISPSSSASDLSESKGLLERPVLCGTLFGETYDNDMEVTVISDCVLYGKTVYGESTLIFFSDFIKIECSGRNENDEKLVIDCPIDDIIHIDGRCIGSGEVALIEICTRAIAVSGTEGVHEDSDAVKLIFVVTDEQWLEKEQMIKSFAARYRDIWRVDAKDNLLLDEDVEEFSMFYGKHYLAETMDSFEDIIYPKGDPDAVSISKRDIELLQPDTFINDTIIDFYIKYLKNKIKPGEKHRFHFFNSFFFRKLADLDKDPGSALQGRAAFIRVRKWTRKVNLFEKDYVFVPVNFNLHWSLLVICHPGEITSLKDLNIKQSPKVPCILHMDSIKGSHSGLKSLIQSYLWEEWKERYPETPAENSLKFSNLRFVPLELPQQENSFDCGLFLLHYVELFLEESPACFNPFKLTKFSTFLTGNWFSPADASLKRSLIRSLIYDLIHELSQKTAPTSCSVGDLLSGCPENYIKQDAAGDLINEPSQKTAPTSCSIGDFLSGCSENYIKQEAVGGFPSEKCRVAKIVSDDSTYIVSDSSTGIELLSTSLGVAHCDKQEGLVPGKFFPTGETESSPECTDHHFQLNETLQKLSFASCLTKEHADTALQLVSSCPNKDDQCPLEGIPLGDEMPLVSIPENEPESDSDEHAVSNPEDEKGNISLLLESSGYVPNSPSLSDGEKPEACVEDSGKLLDCADSQEVDATAKAKDEHTRDGGSGEEECHHGAEGLNGEEMHTTEGGDDGEVNASQEAPFPSIVSNDESSPFKDGIRVRKDRSDVAIEAQPGKRRKATPSEAAGFRRLTRKLSRSRTVS